MVAKIYNKTNEKRSKEKLKKLKENKDIEKLIQTAGCAWHFEEKYKKKRKQFLSKLGYRKFAENSGTLTNMKDWKKANWMESPQLKENILRKNYSAIGCSAMRGCNSPNGPSLTFTFACIYA